MSDKSGQSDQSMEEILGSIRKIISEDNAQSGADAAVEAGGEEEILDLTEEVTAEEVEAARQEPTLAIAGEAVPDDMSEPEVRREPVLGLHGQAQPESAAEEPAPSLDENAGAVPPKPLIMPSLHQSVEIPPEMMDAPEPEEEQAAVDAAPAVDQPVAEEAAATMVEEPVEQLISAISEESVQEIMSESATSATASALGELTRTMHEKSSKLKVGQGEISIADMVKELLRPMLREWLDENLPGIVERVVRREIQKLVDRAEPED